MNINVHESTWSEGQLQPKDIDFKSLFDSVMTGVPSILKNVFPAEKLIALRNQVHQWGLATERKPPQTYIDENFHSCEAGISPRQKTVHNYHAYNFNHPENLPQKLQSGLMEICEPLRIFQNTLTGNDAHYEANEAGQKLHPQFIQYPSGGGVFGQHIHGLEPQRIGLILACSKRGEDFQQGGTYFEVEGNHLESDHLHDLGDLLLFRFDIPHGISTIDEGEELNYESERGRWTFVLPYY